MTEYNREPVPGEWEHRSGDCVIHGKNTAHARAKGALGPYYCCACLLEAAEEQAVRERQAAK